VLQWNRRLDDIWRGKPWDVLDATLCDVRYRYPEMDIEPFKDMIKVSILDSKRRVACAILSMDGY
jgi:phytoene synthase